MKPEPASDLVKQPLTPGRVAWISGILGLSLVGIMLGSLLTGTAEVTFSEVWDIMTRDHPQVKQAAELIVLNIRLPRVILAAVVGFSLSLGGLVFQALLRNPLADPFILGVSSGSAFGAILGIVLGLGYYLGIPVMSFAGALFAIGLVWLVGRRRMGMESSTILLAGVIVNAFFTAIIMFFVATAVDDRLHTMLFWLYGDLSQSRYAEFWISAPVALCASVILYGYAGHLNLVTAGEDVALQVGVDVGRAKAVCFLTVSMLVGVVVAFSGIIGFVGLIVPHLARIIFGADHRLIMPVSALGGAILLVVADTVARTILSPSELPVGVITAFIGAPFFIYLLYTRGSKWSRS